MNTPLRTELVDGVLTVAASGVWATGVSAGGAGEGAAGSTAVDEAERALRIQSVRAVSFCADEVEGWDSSLLAAFLRLMNAAAERGLAVDIGRLPEGMRRLLTLAREVPARVQKTEERGDPGLFELVGGKTLAMPGIALHVTAFVGEVACSLGRLCIGRASFSGRDLWRALRECGVDALPIVSLTSLLLGLILAFVGAIQLRMFGAEVYVAALVGVAMVRVMGPVLTGIVLAGRTGASFAAIIGSMQANEEVDALITFGIDPVDFLVLPRVLGLAIMTPLLAVYADVMGIAGGCVVSAAMLDIAPSAYWDNAFRNIAPSYVWIGLLHALVFGFVVSLCGCYQGMRSGRNAEAVGRATTAAVVNSIVGIIVSTSIITVIFTVIDL
ncbi:MAG: ABC transporter permease [Desulfovibrionaceae bacterium]|nr:ABC transporter permease [Desulfovibrionaceae bacterium]